MSEIKDYVDFVLADGDVLYYASPFSHFKKGDEVIVEDESDFTITHVISAYTVRKDDEALIDFLMNATHSSPKLKKVLAKVNPLDYEEENNG